MKKYLSKCFTLASIILFVYLAYLLFERGFVEAVAVEVQRYSDININNLYLLMALLALSFPAGWVSSKLRLPSNQ
mgnify:CR=1 FL=1